MTGPSGAAEQVLVITRVFEAPRDLVYKVWTQAEHLKHWWGPKGFAIEVAKFDPRPGGLFHYRLHNSEGHEMWGKFTYREVVAPERLVYTSSFSDAEGNTTRAPFNANFPLEILNTVTLTEHEGRTTLTLQGVPVNATAAELEFFQAMFPSMRAGFGGTFEQLTNYLESVQTGALQ